jgi:hypothetical protein
MYFGTFVNSDKRSRAPFANGQFLLTTRAAYDSIGGHEAVKGMMGEDMAIARLMKQRDLRIRVSMGGDICRIRMYETLPDIINGWSRIYFAAKAGSVRHIFAAIGFLLFCCFTAYAALAYGMFRFLHPHGNVLDHGWVSAGIAHWIVLTIVLALFYGWSQASRWNALLFPLNGIILLGILIKASVLCGRQTAEWRGTVYSARSRSCHQLTDRVVVE